MAAKLSFVYIDATRPENATYKNVDIFLDDVSVNKFMYALRASALSVGAIKETDFPLRGQFNNASEAMVAVYEMSLRARLVYTGAHGDWSPLDDSDDDETQVWGNCAPYMLSKIVCEAPASKRCELHINTELPEYCEENCITVISHVLFEKTFLITQEDMLRPEQAAIGWVNAFVEWKYLEESIQRVIPPNAMNEYQKTAFSTMIVPTSRQLDYAITNLGAEAGEVLGAYARYMRDEQGEMSQETRLKIALELGDVLWQIAAAAKIIGFSLQEIADMNIQKLADRKARNALGGTGDDR